MVVLHDTPTREDIADAIKIAQENECIVSLRWHVDYSGNYQRYIYNDDTVDDVYENRLPHVYGL